MYTGIYEVGRGVGERGHVLVPDIPNSEIIRALRPGNRFILEHASSARACALIDFLLTRPMYLNEWLWCLSKHSISGPNMVSPTSSRGYRLNHHLITDSDESYSRSSLFAISHVFGKTKTRIHSYRSRLSHLVSEKQGFSQVAVQI